jgi:hypothetical protein
MRMRPLVLLVIITALILCYTLYKYKRARVERFEGKTGSNVTFLSASETGAFLLGDPDGYVKNMSPYDLHARKAITHAQYLRTISKSALEFSPKRKADIARATSVADRFFRENREADVDTTVIAKLPWVLALTDSTVYEDGMPHTRANIIFLSSRTDDTIENLTRTLIHEKIHVYQRMYPKQMMACLEKRGFRRWKQRLGEPRIRANPDLDPWIYIDPVSKAPMAAYYSSDKPISVTDVVMNDPSFEHPYEKIAYDVARRWNEHQIFDSRL